MTIFPHKHDWENPSLIWLCSYLWNSFSWRNDMTRSHIPNMLMKVPDTAGLSHFLPDKCMKIACFPFHWARSGSRTNTMWKCLAKTKLTFPVLVLTIKSGPKNPGSLCCLLLLELQLRHLSHPECEDQHNTWLSYFCSCNSRMFWTKLFFFLISNSISTWPLCKQVSVVAGPSAFSCAHHSGV